jgi:MGT family glycosyltransferase
MTKAVLLSLPSHGHINPTLPLVAELVRRGATIIYYATAPFRAKIEAAGALFRAYEFNDDLDPSQDLGGPFGLMARTIEASEQILPRLLADLRSDQPDYLLTDSMAVWGNLVAQKLKLPTINLYSTFALSQAVMGELQRSKGPKPPLKDTLAGIPLLGRYFQVARRINRQYAVKTPGLIGFFVNQQALNIVFTSREFQPAVASFDERFVFVGPSVAARHEQVEFPWAQLGAGPLIYISLGTIFNNVADFYRACFLAFADQPCHVVIAIGTSVDESALGAPPANFTVRRYVPQLEVLERAALFITHGGMNSVSEALLEGVPLLVVPQIGDQFFVAQQVAALNVGRSLAMAQVTPARLRELAAQILADPQVQPAARQLGASLKAAGGYQKAADVIAGFTQR